MISNLHIKNYKNLKNLSLENLRQVNLIIGKNNTGKSSLLEAIAILINRSLEIIANILIQRGELNLNESHVENTVNAFASLFTDRKVNFYYPDDNPVYIYSQKESPDKRNFVKICLVQYNENGVLTHNTKIKDIHNSLTSSFKIGIQVTSSNEDERIFALENIHSFLTVGLLLQNKVTNFQMVNAQGIEQHHNPLLWDNIVLSDREKYVIEALKIIESECENIAFVQIFKGMSRRCVVKLKNKDQKIPLSSMGDGINRIMNIILSMVNAENGYLLIDEFENGLHYSVQEQLWKIIFKLAKELNVQVFATTHSQDCLTAFAHVLHSEHQEYGKTIRLDNVKNEIKPTTFESNEVKIATEQNIEIR